MTEEGIIYKKSMPLMGQKTVEPFFKAIAEGLKVRLPVGGNYSIDGYVNNYIHINQGFVSIKEVVARDPNRGTHDNGDMTPTDVILYLPPFLDDSIPPQLLVVEIHRSDLLSSWSYAQMVIEHHLGKLKKHFGIEEIIIIDPSLKP